MNAPTDLHDSAPSAAAPQTAEVAHDEHAPAPGGNVILTLIEAMRPKQWTKNGVLFAALIFSHHAFDVPYLLKAVLASALFCLFSSSGYLYNDLKDVEADRAHPKKRHRPLASGRLPIPLAIFTMIFGTLGGLVMAWWLEPSFFVMSLAYVILTFAYTAYIKHIVILDVMALAAGFILRAVAGAAAISVPISPWFLICTAFLALFLAMSKRQAELMLLDKTAGKFRKNLNEYSLELLDRMISVVSSGTITSYALYTFDVGAHNDKPRWMMLTIPNVLFFIFRYQYLVSRKNQGGAPEQTLLTDRPLMINTILYVVTVLVVLSLGNQ